MHANESTFQHVEDAVETDPDVIAHLKDLKMFHENDALLEKEYSKYFGQEAREAFYAKFVKSSYDLGMIGRKDSDIPEDMQTPRFL